MGSRAWPNEISPAVASGTHPAMTTARFAPSPSGRLHLGHAYSAMLGHAAAREGGQFRLRIEDLDPGRCRAEFVAGIFEDLSWLGLTWDGEVLVQSERTHLYAEALDHLRRNMSNADPLQRLKAKNRFYD